MPTRSLLQLFLLAAIWGGSFLLMRVVAPVLGAIPTAFGRVTLAAVGLLALIVLLRVPRRFNGGFAAALGLGAINSGLPFLLFAVAARVLPAGYSAILNAMTPLMGVIIGGLFFGERINVFKLLGVVLGLAGVAILTGAGPLRVTAAILGGVAACLAATACYGLAGFLARSWMTRHGGVDSRVMALASQMGAVLTLLPFMVWHSSRWSVSWGTVATATWGALAALGLLCSALAYVLYFRLIADVGALKAMAVTFLIPPFGIFWGWLVLGEKVGLAHLAGGGLIALSLWLVLANFAPPAHASIMDRAGRV